MQPRKKNSLHAYSSYLQPSPPISGVLCCLAHEFFTTPTFAALNTLPFKVKPLLWV